MTRRVCVVVTARPSYSRIKTALAAIRERDDLELQLVVSASALLDKFGMAVAQMEADGFLPHRKVYTLIEGDSPTTMAKTTGMGLLELPSVFEELRPDVVVTIADRYETLATAVAASYMNIPLCHVQGGEVTGSIDDKVRHAVTQLADLHLVSTRGARERVVAIGAIPEQVVVTGCPSIDLASEVLHAPELDFNPTEQYGGVGAEIDYRRPFVVVLQHPVTTEFGEARQQVAATLEAVHATGIQALWFWPNPDAGTDGTANGIRSFRESNPDAAIRFFKNFEPHDFLRLVGRSVAIVGNSSCGIREASFLGAPAINIGTRQAGRERGHNVHDVEYDAEEIRRAISAAASNPTPTRSDVYGDGRAGHRIAASLAEADLLPGDSR